MRGKAMADSGTRQLMILSHLPRYPRKITTKELKSYLEDMGYRATIRTIQRDLQALSATHFNIIDVPGTGRGNEGAGWALTENAPVSITKMDPVAALALLLAGQYLDEMLPQSVMTHFSPYVDHAKNVLNEHNHRGFKKWPDKIRSLHRGMNLQPAQVSSDIMTVIYDALLDNKQIKATYNNKANRIINPLGLVHRGSSIYLVCSFEEYGDEVRITALHRFSQVTVLSTPVKTPRGFNLDDYINSGAFGWQRVVDKTITLKLRFIESVGKHLLETPINKTQKHKVNDGFIDIEAQVADTEELRWWLLGFGSNVEVLKPKVMRKEFSTIAAELQGMYRSE